MQVKGGAIGDEGFTLGVDEGAEVSVCILIYFTTGSTLGAGARALVIFGGDIF